MTDASSSKVVDASSVPSSPSLGFLSSTSSSPISPIILFRAQSTISVSHIITGVQKVVFSQGSRRILATHSLLANP